MESTEGYILNHLAALLDDMRNGKPSERSELARRYAVSITDMEKLIAYWSQFVKTLADEGEKPA
jgi:hypothetical protein